MSWQIILKCYFNDIQFIRHMRNRKQMNHVCALAHACTMWLKLNSAILQFSFYATETKDTLVRQSLRMILIKCELRLLILGYIMAEANGRNRLNCQSIDECT